MLSWDQCQCSMHVKLSSETMSILQLWTLHRFSCICCWNSEENSFNLLTTMWCRWVWEDLEEKKEYFIIFISFISVSYNGKVKARYCCTLLIFEVSFLPRVEYVSWKYKTKVTDSQFIEKNIINKVTHYWYEFLQSKIWFYNLMSWTKFYSKKNFPSIPKILEKTFKSESFEEKNML